MEQAVLPVLVSYHTDRWIRVALRSYRHHFPEGPILVVDNNPEQGEPGWTPRCEQERAWLRGRPDVLLVKNERPRKKHGTGIDRAVAWCRDHEVAFLLHFEPDCLVSGRRWFDDLWAAVESGAWMAGSDFKWYGPIHPTPSLWRVSEIRASFEAQPRGDDVRHRRFRDLFDLDGLVADRRADGDEHWEWWRDHWDTAQKAWFEAAVHDRARLVRTPGDFHHYWCGSTVHRDHPALADDPRLASLLADDHDGLPSD